MANKFSFNAISISSIRQIESRRLRDWGLMRLLVLALLRICEICRSVSQHRLTWEACYIFIFDSVLTVKSFMSEDDIHKMLRIGTTDAKERFIGGNVHTQVRYTNLYITLTLVMVSLIYFSEITRIKNLL